MSGGTDYGFAVGRVRSLEATVLDRTHYDRLVGASSPEDLTRLLADTWYGRFLGEGHGTVDIDSALAAAAADGYSQLADYCLDRDRWLTDLFSLDLDVRNLKVFIKARLAGRENGGGLVHEYGDWDRTTLQSLVSAERDAQPTWARRAVDLATERYQRDGNPARIDYALDRLQQEQSLALAARSEFVRFYLAVHADVTNLRTLVRAKAAEVEQWVREEAFLEGGSLPLPWLAELLSRDWADITREFRITPYAGIVEQGTEFLLEYGSLLRMERLGREQKLRFLSQTRYVTFGYEPLVAYYLFRVAEVENLRQLYAAVATGLSEDERREAVAYVT